MERLTGRDAYGDIVVNEEMQIIASRGTTYDDLHNIINHLADKVREKIKQYKVIHFETDQVDFDNYDYCFLSHFGKTVFLTREEAEAELNSYLKKYNKDVERI